jgi:hypothetical protein
MAGQEIESDHWDESLGLDLLPPFVCAGFRTLSLASVQNLGSSIPSIYLVYIISLPKTGL